MSRNLIKYTGFYALLIFVSVLLGWVWDLLACAAFFMSSAFFSATIIYETWKTSKPLKEVTYPTRKAASGRNEIRRLAEDIEETISGKSPSTYVMGRLHQILVRKTGFRSGMAADIAELKNPKELEKLGYDDLAGLLNEGNIPRTRNQRIKVLNEILDKLEKS